MLKAVIFDLDGVIVSTDEYHYRSWKKVADEEGIYFDRKINERLRGVSRMDSLEIMLEKTDKEYAPKEKAELANRKNTYYRDLLNDLTPKDILPGVLPLLTKLKSLDIKLAVGSSSRNTPLILEKIGMSTFFDAVADGNQISNSKPDPEVFLLAAQKLGVEPEKCAVVEDADAGIEAAAAGRMFAIGVGSAMNHPKADLSARNLAALDAERLLEKAG